ncbi:UNKNOWN [Stylonychia lemnae]|uniref:Uncharacterized protein n=1 Tax=Stylonychia lemnae TaxID=5949 RepID=A0A078ANR5_STYLE|nr:UNKNOWN [Stylonychia lemnae]|eukprot:CDW83990.1 UNKNOWN [Stylonychia lemnae]
MQLRKQYDEAIEKQKKKYLIYSKNKPTDDPVLYEKCFEEFYSQIRKIRENGLGDEFLFQLIESNPMETIYNCQLHEFYKIYHFPYNNLYSNAIPESLRVEIIFRSFLFFIKNKNQKKSKLNPTAKNQMHFRQINQCDGDIDQSPRINTMIVDINEEDSKSYLEEQNKQKYQISQQELCSRLGDANYLTRIFKFVEKNQILIEKHLIKRLDKYVVEILKKVIEYESDEYYGDQGQLMAIDEYSSQMILDVDLKIKILCMFWKFEKAKIFIYQQVPPINCTLIQYAARLQKYHWIESLVEYNLLTTSLNDYFGGRIQTFDELVCLVVLCGNLKTDKLKDSHLVKNLMVQYSNMIMQDPKKFDYQVMKNIKKYGISQPAFGSNDIQEILYKRKLEMIFYFEKIMKKKGVLKNKYIQIEVFKFI